MKKVAVAIAGAVAALGVMINTASANTTVRAGTLECDISGGIGLIFVEKQAMTCTFKGANGGAPDFYTGKIEEVGITLGATAGGVMV